MVVGRRDGDGDDRGAVIGQRAGQRKRLVIVGATVDPDDDGGEHG